MTPIERVRERDDNQPADPLEIEAGAKRRLADEYDSAQERGEVVAANDGAKKRIPVGNSIVATAADIGLTPKTFHEAREIRDAGQEDASQPARIVMRQDGGASLIVDLAPAALAQIARFATTRSAVSIIKPRVGRPPGTGKDDSQLLAEIRGLMALGISRNEAIRTVADRNPEPEVSDPQSTKRRLRRKLEEG